MSTNEILTDARRRVENGWSQGAMRRRGSVCMIGALAAAGCTEYGCAEELLLEAIHGLGYAYPSIVAFNDAGGRTLQQILQVYDAAIALSMPEAFLAWRPLQPARV